MKKFLIVTLILTFISVGFLFAKEGGKTKVQTKCPICKMEVNKELHADYKGKRVYFGCNGCPDEFNKNPEKYIKQLESEGITLEKSPVLQTKCPICEMDINKNLFADYQGKRVYFGCSGCPDEFNKNPEKYIKQLESEGITLENSPKDSIKTKHMDGKKMSIKMDEAGCNMKGTKCKMNHSKN